MSEALLQYLISSDARLGTDIWNLQISETDFSNLCASISKLQTQLTVQKALLSSERLLREHPSDQLLPNQQAIRVKHLLKFVFEKNNREPTRKRRLQELDCSSLKLCGLSYTVREITELASEAFEFLVKNIANFVESRQLSLHLCRDDINKAVLGDFDPDDEELFASFVTTHLGLRRALRKRLAFSDQSPDKGPLPEDLQEQPGNKAARPQKRLCSEEYSMHDRQVSSARGKRRRPQFVHYMSLNRHAEIQFIYSNAPVHLIPDLGDLLAEAVKSSHQWKVERALGETTTDCLTAIIPKDATRDISITLWVGAEAGHQLNNKFNLVPKWTSLPTHGEL
ncbi:uncharacterized protein BDW70DRAFT_33765 [Aspergillus foveolatus]|uniref:uncharacterized protein n=1 Tax=Aspergillus foveolatus TaxID=210207 RepID=UPI003CCCCC2D